MKQQVDSHRREVNFQVGDYVLLRVQSYLQRSLAHRKCEKLSPRFFGPYKIIRCVGPVAYELELPASSKVHPIFHVSLLRPAHSQQAVVLLALSLLLKIGNLPYLLPKFLHIDGSKELVLLWNC